MARYKIAWMPGDGVGNDVMEAARIVLDALNFDAEYIPADIGWEFWCKEGDPLPPRTIEILRKTDCALFGAITSKPRDEANEELHPSLNGKGFSYFSPIVKLRQLFNLHTNLRPCKAYPGNPLNYRDDIDLVVFRENTEGMYGGVEWFPLPKKVADVMADPEVGHPTKMEKFRQRGLDNIAVSTRIMSKQGCENICRQAFEYAKKFKRRSVTLVEKPNVLRETGGLITRIFRDVAKEYSSPSPEAKRTGEGRGGGSAQSHSPSGRGVGGEGSSSATVAAWETNIDAMCMWLVKNPQDYDCLVAENMFGDIISDLAAGLVGGLGFACAANIGDDFAVFEPTHGSAPKYAGKYVVNPMAMILSVKLMFDWLGEAGAAQRLENAVATVIREGKVATYDVKGRDKGDSTLDVAREVASNL